MHTSSLLQLEETQVFSRQTSCQSYLLPSPFRTGGGSLLHAPTASVHLPYETRFNTLTPKPCFIPPSSNTTSAITSFAAFAGDVSISEPLLHLWSVQLSSDSVTHVPLRHRSAVSSVDITYIFDNTTAPSAWHLLRSTNSSPLPDYIHSPHHGHLPSAISPTSVMGFSLFKKKNKDKAPTASPNLSVPTNNRPMASPNLRNPNTPSSAGSPRVVGSPMMNSPALSVNEWGQVPSIATGRRIKLRCVLDPLANANGNLQEDVNNKGEALKELFYITTELDAPIETLRHQIEQELAVEGKYSVGIFKVCPKWLFPSCNGAKVL